MVAVIQLAITLGAAGGGVLFDSVGAVVLCFSAFVILVGAISQQPESNLGCETCANAVPSNL